MDEGTTIPISPCGPGAVTAPLTKQERVADASGRRREKQEGWGVGGGVS